MYKGKSLDAVLSGRRKQGKSFVMNYALNYYLNNGYDAIHKDGVTVFYKTT